MVHLCAEEQCGGSSCVQRAVSSEAAEADEHNLGHEEGRTRGSGNGKVEHDSGDFPRWIDTSTSIADPLTKHVDVRSFMVHAEGCNLELKEGRHEEALAWFTRSLQCVDCDERGIAYCNRSACYAA